MSADTLPTSWEHIPVLAREGFQYLPVPAFTPHFIAVTFLLSVPDDQFHSMRMLAITFPIVLLNSLLTLLSAPQGQLVQVQQWTSDQVEASHHDFSVPHMKAIHRFSQKYSWRGLKQVVYVGSDPGKC